jgi:hypothetical protein
MKQAGKKLYHKLKAYPRTPEVMHATERAYSVNADGTIRAAYKRGISTQGEWRKYAVKPEFGTLAAIEGILLPSGFVRGPAPRGTLAPSLQAVQQWDWDGQMEASDGCGPVEPDGVCQHGARSWMLVYRVI